MKTKQFENLKMLLILTQTDCIFKLNNFQIFKFGIVFKLTNFQILKSECGPTSILTAPTAMAKAH